MMCIIYNGSLMNNIIHHPEAIMQLITYGERNIADRQKSPAENSGR